MAQRPGRAPQRRTDASLLVFPYGKRSKGGGEMVTYAELFAFCGLIVAIIRLVHDFENRDK